jgi:hypothetical protein
LLLAWIALMPPSADATEGEWRWRFFQGDDQASLHAAEHDATDAIASPRFSCIKGKGWIEVVSEMGDQEREAIAEFIRKNEYPRVHLVPPAEYPSLLAEIFYSEMYGWMYKFDMRVGTRAFAEFAKTGVFEYRVGSAIMTAELKEGLANIALFDQACR